MRGGVGLGSEMRTELGLRNEINHELTLVNEMESKLDFTNETEGNTIPPYISCEYQEQAPSDLSLLKNNLASRICYCLTAASSQIWVLFHQYISLLSEHIAVVVTDLLIQYSNRLRDRFKKLHETRQVSIHDVEGRVSAG